MVYVKLISKESTESRQSFIAFSAKTYTELHVFFSDWIPNIYIFPPGQNS